MTYLISTYQFLIDWLVFNTNFGSISAISWYQFFKSNSTLITLTSSTWNIKDRKMYIVTGTKIYKHTPLIDLWLYPTHLGHPSLSDGSKVVIIIMITFYAQLFFYRSKYMILRSAFIWRHYLKLQAVLTVFQISILSKWPICLLGLGHTCTSVDVNLRKWEKRHRSEVQLSVT
jgi:hypothetical protein